jgi:hypothetical protein
MPEETPADPANTTAAPNAETLARTVRDFLRKTAEIPDLDFDADGDLPIRFGTTAIFVRVFGDPPVVRVFSPMLGEVDASGRLKDALNELNSEALFLKYVFLDGTLTAVIDLFGNPLVTDHVYTACGLLGTEADQRDEELQSRFGGKPFFGEFAAAPKPRPGQGGYL